MGLEATLTQNRRLFLFIVYGLRPKRITVGFCFSTVGYSWQLFCYLFLFKHLRCLNNNIWLKPKIKQKAVGANKKKLPTKIDKNNASGDKNKLKRPHQNNILKYIKKLTYVVQGIIIKHSVLITGNSRQKKLANQNQN
jgi:hypothetical protein